jgi:hypothetical protein
MNRSGLGLLAVAPALVLSGCAFLPLLDSGGAERDEAGAIVEIGAVDVFSFQVGDCLLSLETTSESQESVDASGTVQVTQGDGVPCSSTHIYEVYHVEADGITSAFEVSQADSIADDICFNNFASFAGISFESTSLGFTSVFPTAESFATGDTEVTCLIYAEDLAMVTGSLKGRGPSFVLEVASNFRAGECLNGLDGDSLLDAAAIPVACQDSHLWEVYYVGSLDDGLEPPLDLIAEETCLTEYREFIGVAWENSFYTVSWYQPSEETYRFGDRKLACLVHTEDVTPVSGSLKGIRQ